MVYKFCGLTPQEIAVEEICKGNLRFIRKQVMPRIWGRNKRRVYHFTILISSLPAELILHPLPKILLLVSKWRFMMPRDRILCILVNYF